MNSTTIATAPTRRRTRRSVLATTVLGGLLLATACGESPRGEVATPGFGTDGGAFAAPTTQPATSTAPSTAPSTDPPAPQPVQDDSQPQGDNDNGDGSNGNGNGNGNNGNGNGGNDDDGQDAGGDMEPWGDDDVPAPGPCDAVLATGARLLVSPEPAVLESGVMSSALDVTNCGDEPIDWTAATIPNVTLANGGGNLAGGSSSELAFTIDSSAYEPGAIEFKIKVSEPGHNHYVDIHAFRELVGSDLVSPDLGLTAGDEAGGCAIQCIVSAVLKANVTSPDVTLQVGLNEAAVVNVYVSEQAPSEVDGQPAFPGVGPIASSGGATTDFTTSISPLSAATKYHIIVEATDDTGNVSYQSGSFTTITPLELPDDFVDPGPPPGCAVQCITTALLSVTDDPSEMAISIDTHTSAMLDVWVSENEPQEVDGVPTFGDLDPAATTDGLDVQHWEAVIPGLELNTDYHVIVRARDLTGHEAYQVGTFHSAHAALITVRFHAIHVVDDADAGDNPGELTFRWGTEDNPFGYDSVTVESGQAFLIGHEPADVETRVESDGGFLPTFYVSASEYDDPGGVQESCGASELHTYFGEAQDCGTRFNSASTGIITPESFEGMQRCSDFELPAEWADEACTAISSFDENTLGFNGQPVFWAVVAFRVTAV